MNVCQSCGAAVSPFMSFCNASCRMAFERARSVAPPPRTFKETEVVRCGVAVVLQHDGRVLMGQRKGSHGAGSWSFPGGWMEFGESFEEAARRELREETGLELLGVTKVIDAMSTVFHSHGRHSVTVLLSATSFAGEPQVLEPDKLEGPWTWVDPERPPQPLFEPLNTSTWIRGHFKS